MSLRTKAVPHSWFTDGMILIAANFIAAIGNYLFQALMRRHLSWSEFGYLNAVLSLIVFAGVPLTAAGQTVTHYLALISIGGDEERMKRAQAASLKLLRRLTLLLVPVCLLLLYPVADFLHFPRMSLAWAALLWVPVNLWSSLGTAWCAGLGRFRLLALLLIATACVRLAAGAVGTQLYPWAESGILASMVAGFVLAGVVAISPHHGVTTRLREKLLDTQLLLYGLAALSVTFGAFAFLQADQLIAQRHFPGEVLGRYSGAGLLGRAIVWTCLPILTVYFTRRSGHDSSHRSPVPLLWIYLGLLVVGAIALMILKNILLQLFLGQHDPALSAMTSEFALVMLPIGVLQLLGYHYLATRRIAECLAFGLCGLAYVLLLVSKGTTPFGMLTCMGAAATASIIVLVVATLARKTFHRA